MKCFNCGHENVTAGLVCVGCGAALKYHGGISPAPNTEPVRTSGMAVAGLVCAFLCGLLGIILSAVAYNECKRSDGRIQGEGMAIAGIVVGVLNILLGLAIGLGSQGTR